MLQNLAFKLKNFNYKLNCDKELIGGEKIVCSLNNDIFLGDVVKCCENKMAEDFAKFIRIATEDDIRKAEQNLSKKQYVLDKTKELISKHDLKMKLVDVEFTLDNSKVIISYVCEDRVDFRELVKELASALKSRIELKQIGVRDQAKIVGSLGICGKEVCCKQFLDDFDKVSIKMAKVQGLSLNPTKISGVCGRLMCCLAYENELYTELNSKMPKLNSKVTTPDGEGVVCFNNLLKQKVSVKFVNENDIKINEYELKDVKIISQDKAKNG